MGQNMCCNNTDGSNQGSNLNVLPGPAPSATSPERHHVTPPVEKKYVVQDSVPKSHDDLSLWELSKDFSIPPELINENEEGPELVNTC